MKHQEIPVVVEDGARLRLDTPTIETRIAHYPEPLREPVSWLASYTREECNRDLGILASQAAALGFEFDSNNWSKVLRGRWNRDANEQPLDSPIIKLEKLLRAIDALRRDSLLREQAGKVPFIWTPTAEEIFNYITTRRAHDRINKFGMIVGHTGTQKSATCREYCRRNNHGNCVMVEAPSSPSITQLITDLSERYGCGRQSTWDRKRNTINKSVNSRKSIIIENIQRLYNERAEENQLVFSYLQKLQEDTGCTIILTLTPVFMTKLKRGLAQGYFEQFIGRVGGDKAVLTLEDYPSAEDITAIAKAFGLTRLNERNVHLTENEKEITMTTLDYLTRICREPGRIRVLFEALQSAKVRAAKRGKEFNIELIMSVRGDD